MYFEKLRNHSKLNTRKGIHSEDVGNLFVAAAHLRNPLSASTPDLKELAGIAKMSLTKFKTSFRHVFGSAPIAYRHRIRMQYAREQLMTGTKAPTELSYELGYAHPSNFTAAYKKHFSKLPSAEVSK
jgi:AraC-like DNA-binding protein